MSRAAIRNKQLAIIRSLASRFCRGHHSTSLTASFSPTAYCKLPIAASQYARCCTVTFPLTSVTHLPLAESVLIGVGKPYFDGLPGVSAPWTLGFEALHCSFGGGPCIQ